MDAAANASEPLARVSQLAGVLGVPATELLATLSLGEAASESAWVPREKTDELLRDFTPRQNPESLWMYISAAFSIAREAGPSWQLMPLPLLKNRLLSLTNREFHEWDYGWPNLKFLPSAYGSRLQLDTSTAHGAVVWRADDAEGPVPRGDIGALSDGDMAGRRIRQDLWNATIDYSSNARYVWDISENRALRSTGGNDEGITFPTVTPEDVLAWRRDCVALWKAQNGDADAEALDRWAHRPREHTPHRFQESWRDFQRVKVAEVIDDFFRSNSITPPADAYVQSKVTQAREVDARRLLSLVVRAASDAELESIQLPVALVLRALREGKVID